MTFVPTAKASLSCSAIEMGVSTVISRNVSKPALIVILRLNGEFWWNNGFVKFFLYERPTSPSHNYLWHTSPTFSCSSGPCKHLRRDLESSWPEHRTLCTRTNPFPVEHDIKDECITNMAQITARACNAEQASWYMTHMCAVMDARFRGNWTQCMWTGSLECISHACFCCMFLLRNH